METLIGKNASLARCGMTLTRTKLAFQRLAETANQACGSMQAFAANMKALREHQSKG